MAFLKVCILSFIIIFFFRFISSGFFNHKKQKRLLAKLNLRISGLAKGRWIAKRIEQRSRCLVSERAGTDPGPLTPAKPMCGMALQYCAIRQSSIKCLLSLKSQLIDKVFRKKNVILLSWITCYFVWSLSWCYLDRILDLKLMLGWSERILNMVETWILGEEGRFLWVELSPQHYMLKS